MRKLLAIALAFGTLAFVGGVKAAVAEGNAQADALRICDQAVADDAGGVLGKVSKVANTVSKVAGVVGKATSGAGGNCVVHQYVKAFK
jgi:tetrahydromethanopterin S-methyltransferase subunit D